MLQKINYDNIGLIIINVYSWCSTFVNGAKKVDSWCCTIYKWAPQLSADSWCSTVYNGAS